MPRENTDEDEHRLRTDSMSVIQDGEAHASGSPCCCAQCRECILVLASGLADRGANDDFINLVLAEACFPQGADVGIGDRLSAVCDLIDKCAHRLSEPIVSEGSAPDLRRRPTLPFEYSRNEGIV